LFLSKESNKFGERGGVEIKLKLGSEETADNKDNNKAGSEPSEDSTQINNKNEEKKEDVEKLRTVIKVNENDTPSEENKEETESKEAASEEKKTPGEEKKEGENKQITPNNQKSSESTSSSPGSSREDLEQRRNMLQSIKDFDFQIKKNQEDIGKMNEKLDGLTKDLDDLVSLYEIVSEQMNPFVGLSKVTKKRIDALENFTQEIEEIKLRMGDVESVVEKGVGGIKRLTKNFDKKVIKKESNELPSKSESKNDSIEDSTEDTKNDTTKEEVKVEEEIKEEAVEQSDLTVSEPEIKTEDIPNEPISKPNNHIDKSVSIPTTLNENQFVAADLSDNDLDKILNKTLENIIAEQNIDNMINDFLLNLK